MKLLKNLLALVSIITVTAVFTGCSSSAIIGEDIGDLNEVDKYIEKDSSTLTDVLSKLNNPNLEKRDYKFQVSRNVLSATLKNTKEKLVIIQFSVDSDYTEKQYRTIKDIVLLLDDNKINNNSIVKDVKYFGAAYLISDKDVNYYVMSNEELKIWTNMSYPYLSGNLKTGNFKLLYNVNEENIIKDCLLQEFGEISDLHDEQELNMLGQNGFKEDVFPKIRVVKQGSFNSENLKTVNSALEIGKSFLWFATH